MLHPPIQLFLCVNPDEVMESLCPCKPLALDLCPARINPHIIPTVSPYPLQIILIPTIPTRSSYPPPILHTIFTVHVASHKARKIEMGLNCCGCSEQPQGGSIVSMRLRIYHQDFYIKKYEACFLYISNFLMQVSCQAIWIDLNFINNVYSNLITSVGINK